MTTTTAAVLSAELDASGFRQGGQEVRRTLEDIGSGVRAGMSDIEAYNRIQGAAGASAVETARRLGLLNNALRDAERAFNEQARHVGDLSRKFEVLRAAAGESVAALQRFGRTSFTGDLSNQLTRLSADMARILDAGGKGAVAEARRIGREMTDLAKQQLAAQIAVAEQEAKAKVEAARKAAAEIKASLKGQKTEESTAQRQAAQDSAAAAKAEATAQIAAAKQAAEGVLAEMRRRTEEVIRLKQRETQVMGEYERAHDRMRTLERQALESAARATEAEIAHNNAMKATTAEADRFTAMAQRAKVQREASTHAIQRETQALEANAAAHRAAAAVPTTGNTLGNRLRQRLGAMAGEDPAPPVARPVPAPLPPLPTPPLPSPIAAASATGGARQEKTDLTELAAEVDRIIQRYDYLTAATHRRTEALETLSEARRRGVIDDDEEYDRLTRLVSGQQRHAEQLDQLRRSLDPAAAAEARYREEVERVSRILDANRVDETERARILRQVADAHDPAIIAARKEAEALRALEDRLDRAGAAARRMREEQQQLDRALSRGTIDAGRHAELTRLIEEQHGAITGRDRRSANSRALTALVPQMNDVFVTAVMGMNPLMILAQQGPQVVDVLMMAGKEAALAAAKFALLATPIIAAAGALALYEKHRASLREMDRANALQGGALGMTSDQMGAFATAAGKAGEISVSASRSMVSEYTRVGKIAPEVMGRLIAMNRDYATLTGQDTAEATKKLAGYMAEPAKAAEELADSINLLSDAEVRRIKTLTESGQRTAAQTELVAALERRTRGAAEQTSFWVRQWHNLGAAMSDYADRSGKAVDRVVNGPTLEDKIKGLEAERALPRDDRQTWQRLIDVGNAMRLPSLFTDTRPVTRPRDVIEAEYRDALIQKAEDERRARAKKMTADQMRDELELNNLSRSYLPVIEQTQTLEAHQQRLQRAIEDGKDTNGLYTRSLVEVQARLREVADAATPATQAIAALQAEAMALNAPAGYERGLASRILQATQNGKRDITGDEATDIERDYRNVKDGEQRDALEIARQQAEAQRNLAAAQATGNEAAIKKAEIEVRLIELAKEYGPTFDKNAWRTQLQTKADAELTGAIDAQIAAMAVQVQSANRLADARAQGGEAAMAAARADNVFNETLARTGDASRAAALSALEYRKAVIEAAAARAEWNRTMRDQTGDLSREADAWTRGGATAARQARLGNEALGEIRRRGTRDPREIEEITAGIAARDLQQRQRDLAQMAAEQRQQIELAKVEFDLLGKSNAERARATAELEAQRKLLEAGADLTDRGTQAYVKQAGELARTKALIEEQAQIAGDFGKTLAKGVEDAILNGGKGALEALAEDMKRIFVRATITKPLETAITGELTKLFNPGVLSATEDNTPKAAERIDSYVDAMLRTQGALPVIVLNSAGGGGGANPAAIIAGSALNARATNGRVTAFDDALVAAGMQHGVDPAILYGIMMRESSGNPRAVGPMTAGGWQARGLMQFSPATAARYGVDPTDPRDAIFGAARYIADLTKQLGSVEKALASYGGFVTKDPSAYIGYINQQAATFRGAPSLTGAAGRDAVIEVREIRARSMDRAFSIPNGESAGYSGPAATQDDGRAVPVVMTGAQAALGSATALLGSLSGTPGGGIAGQVIAAGGPAGIMQSLGQLGQALGITGPNSVLGSLGGVGSTVSGFMNQTLYGSSAQDLFSAGQSGSWGPGGFNAGAGSGGVTVGNVIGGGMNAIGAGMSFANGQYYAGTGQAIAAIMSFIPGLQMFAPLAAIGGSILESLLGKKKQEYPVAAGGAEFVGGSPAQWSGATDNKGDAGTANQIATGIRDALSAYFDATNARQSGGINVGVENKNGRFRTFEVEGHRFVGGDYGSFDEAMIATIRRKVSEGIIAVGVDEYFATMKSKATELNDFMQDLEFAKGFSGVVRKWSGAGDPLTAYRETGTQEAGTFGKEILEFLKKTRELFSVSGTGLRAYARGTDFAAPGVALVGEEGPELVVMRGGERVLTARETAQALAGMGEGADSELVHLRPDELDWMHRTLGGGRRNPRTGLWMFLEGETGGVSDTGSSGGGRSSDGPGSENAAHGTYGATTADRDAAYGGGWGTGTSGSDGGWFSGFMAAIDRATTAIGDFGRSLGLTDQEIGQLSAMSAISPGLGFSAVAAATYGAAYGLGSIASAISGEPMSVDATFSSDTTGSGGGWSDRASAEAALTRLSDVLAEIGRTGDAERIGSVVGQSLVGESYTAGTISDVARIATGNWGRNADGLFSATAQQFRAVWDEISAGMQTLVDAGLPVPQVLSDAAAGMQRMADVRVANGIDGTAIIGPAQERAAQAQADAIRVALSDMGINGDIYEQVRTLVGQMQAGTFSPVGQDFAANATLMRRVSEAINTATGSVPEHLQAAIRQMDALAASRARIDAQIANVRDDSTDVEKGIARDRGYWSTNSTELVRALESVGYQGPLLTQKLEEGNSNAVARRREDYIRDVRDPALNAARGESWRTQIREIDEQTEDDRRNSVALGLGPVDSSVADITLRGPDLAVQELRNSRIRNMLVGMDQGERDRVAAEMGGDVASVAGTLMRGYSATDQRIAQANATISGSRADTRNVEDMARVTRQAEEMNRTLNDVARETLAVVQARENEAVATRRAEEDRQRAEGFASRLGSATAALTPYDITAQRAAEDAERARARERELRTAGSDEDRVALRNIYDVEERALAGQRAERDRQRSENFDMRALSARGAAGQVDSYGAETQRLAVQRAQELRQAESELERQRLAEIHAIEDQARALARSRELRAADVDTLTRGMDLLGRSRDAQIARFGLQATEQIEQAQARGIPVGQLQQVLAGERARLEFDSARTDYIEALDRQTRAIEDSIEETERNSGWLARLSTSFRDSINSARLSESSPFGLEARLLESRRLFDETYTKFQDTSLPQEERERLAGLLQTYGQARIDIASQYYGSTDRLDWDSVMSVWASIGGMSEDQVDATRIQLARQKEQLDELRRTREQAERLGERQIGSVEETKRVMEESYGRMNSALGTMSAALSVGFAGLGIRISGRSATDHATMFSESDALRQAGMVGLDTGMISRLATQYGRSTEWASATAAIAQSVAGYTGVLGNGELNRHLAAMDPQDARRRGAEDLLQQIQESPARAFEVLTAINVARSLGYTGTFGNGAHTDYLGTASEDYRTQFQRLMESAMARYNAGTLRTDPWVGYAEGGLVGNGISGVDSVLATYAGGGHIALAGREFVIRTAAVTPETLPWLRYINDNGSLPEYGQTSMAVGQDYEPPADSGHPEMTVSRQQPSDNGGGVAVLARSVDRLTAEVETLRSENRVLTERLIAVQKEHKQATVEGHKGTVSVLTKAETRRRGQP